MAYTAYTAYTQPALPSDTDLTEFRKELTANMQFLAAHLLDLPDENTRNFILSLITFYNTREFLSDKQAIHACKWYWHLKNDKASDSTSMTPEVSKPRIATISWDTKALFALFTQAKKSGLTFPKIRFTLGQPGNEINYKIYARVHKNPGNLVLKQDGKHILELSPAGDFFWDSSVENAEKLQLKHYLDSEDLVKKLAATGRQTNNCCFCSTGLTNHISVAVGYGPICADNWGLPWDEETYKETVANKL
jgi:hypothetical protein